MNNLKTLLGDDSDRIFLDWSIPARLLEVHTEFDVEAGRVVESIIESSIHVIPQEDQPQLLENVATTLNVLHTRLLVRKQELPQSATLTSARIVIGTFNYAVQSVRECNFAGVAVLECVRTACRSETES